MACVKLGGKPGHEYMFRERAEGKNAVTEIFGKANANFKKKPVYHDFCLWKIVYSYVMIGNNEYSRKLTARKVTDHA